MADEFQYKVPAPADYSEKETYAFAGLAIYWAQVLEHGTLNLAVVLKLPKVGAVDQTLFEGLFENLSRKTLGQLINAAKAAVEIDAKTEILIKEALELRNRLIHHFFREHAEDLVSEAGRKVIIQELSEMILKFKEADFAIETLCLPLWEKYGVDETFIEREMEAITKKARARDAVTEIEGM